MKHFIYIYYCELKHTESSNELNPMAIFIIMIRYLPIVTDVLAPPLF